MKIIVSGASGRMGSLLSSYASKQDHCQIVGSIDNWQDVEAIEADVIIDFSHTSQLKAILSYAKKNQSALVLGTTGYTACDDILIDEASREIAIIKSSNYSLGVQVILDAIKQIVPHLTSAYDIEIVEAHHKHKKDAPSGTALMIFDTINKISDEKYSKVASHDGGRKQDTIGMHAIRGGSVFGEHKVMFIGEHEKIEISHTAFDKLLFVEGAYKAATWICQKEKGLYQVSDMLKGVVNE